MALAGRLAIVTGAGSGIGRASSRVLAKEGAILVVADRNIQAAEETVSLIGAKHSVIQLDVSDSKSVQRAFEEILEKFKKPPTILVNSAGITRDGFLLKMEESDYDMVQNVNSKGTFLMMKSFAKQLVDHKTTNGSIVNISSVVSRMGNIGQSNYAGSKGAVESMTRVASREFGRYGIRVNAIVPGFINTPMTETVPDKIKNMIIMQTSLRRFGEVDEIAEAVAFLSSDKASYITGALLEVSGGV